MKVLVAGASGVFGRHITESLLASGHEVLGLGRKGAGEALTKQGVVSVAGDLMNRDSLLRAVDGLTADVVVHAATALCKMPTRHKDVWATDALRIEGTKNLIDAARAIGATRFVVESMIFGYGYLDAGPRPLAENELEFGPIGPTKQLERHLAGLRSKEQQAFNADGIEGIALRFGLGKPGEAYNIVDDERIGFGDHMREVARAFKTPRPMTIPGWVLPLPYVRAVLNTNLALSNEKAKRELGWRPMYPTSADGLAAIAQKHAVTQ
jgi:nucleoside-diphosphate-sugar epimerase